MKKSLIALAVLGSFAGAAAAQSTATLYGKIDVGYGVGNGGTYEKSQGNDSKFQQWGNSRTTSRWGLKGSEDLGNGLKAYFNLESKIAPETGASGSFDRAAIVGLSGSFGAIQAGRQTTVMNNVLGQFDVSGTPNLTSATGNAGISAISQKLGGTTYARVDSAIAYISPNFSGFQMQAALVLKNDDILGVEGKNTGDVDFWGNPILLSAKNIYTLGFTYNYGNFTVGAAYESKLYDGMSASWGLGLKYDFGSFVLSGGYTDNHMDADGKGFYIGAKAPIGAFTIGAQIGYNTDVEYSDTKFVWLPNANMNGFDLWSFTGTEKAKPWALEVFATYDLSKRTQLYAQAGAISGDNYDYFMGGSRKYSASFGIIHNF